MRILFSPVDSEATGCQRLIFPLDALKDKVEKNYLNSHNLEEQIKNSDLVALQCLSGPHQFELIDYIQTVAKKKLIIDYDDNFAALPRNIINRIGLSQEEITQNWAVYLKAADLITVATPALAEVVAEFTDKPIKVLPNYIRRQDYVDSLSYNPWDFSKEIRILYSCSESHAEDIKYITIILKTISKIFPKVKIISHGGLDFGLENPDFTGRTEHFGKVSYDGYLKFLRTVKPHIFIAPLQDNAHNRCRSNLKYLQSGVLKTAFICNDLPPYDDVQDLQTGYKVSNRISWLWNLYQLCSAPELLINLGQNSYQDVGRHLLEDHSHKWYNAYKECLEG